MNVVFDYYSACCIQPNPEKLQGLLHDKIVLVLTKGDKTRTIQGVEEVMLFFLENFFNVTSNTHLTNLNVTQHNIGEFSALVTGEQDKTNYGGRILFVENASFLVVDGKIARYAPNCQTGLLADVDLK